MSPLPFSSIGFHPLPEGLSLSAPWFSAHWPWLLSPALLGLAAVILIRSWSWLLDRETGRWWPVPASILPALIPIARSLEDKAPTGVETVTVVLLLFAVAGLQIYGQERNNRDRIKTEDRITEQKNLLTEQRDLLIASINEARAGRDEARAFLLAFVNQTEEGREEAEKRAERTDALLVRIADGISAAAASAEEAREEE